MPHVLIVGITESGKTSLAKMLAQEYSDREVGVLVLDPLGDQWPADFQTRDPDAFLEVVKKSRRCAVFIDESGESVGRYNEEMFWLATRARHLGHNSHFITQRAQQLNKTVRDQCSEAFIFCISRYDAELLKKEFNDEQLDTASQLGRFEYFHVGRFSRATKHALQVPWQREIKTSGKQSGTARGERESNADSDSRPDHRARDRSSVVADSR